LSFIQDLSQQSIMPVLAVAIKPGAEGSSHYRLESQEFDQVGDYTIIFQAKIIDGYAKSIQTTVRVAEAG